MINIMKKGPKWSAENVRTMLMVLRSRLEHLEDMASEKLDKECAKRLELASMVGQTTAVKKEALVNWHWRHVMDDVGATNEVEVIERKETNVDEELEKVVQLLRDNTSATDGGIRNTLFKGRDNIMNEVLEYGFKIQKIKRVKTNAGTEVITLA